MPASPAGMTPVAIMRTAVCIAVRRTSRMPSTKERTLCAFLGGARKDSFELVLRHGDEAVFWALWGHGHSLPQPILLPQNEVWSAAK